MRVLSYAIIAVTLFTACASGVPTPRQTDPQPQPLSPSASQVATIMVSPSPPRTCEAAQIEARAIVTVSAATVTATCITCFGRFPPPSPGTTPITATAVLRSTGQGIFSGEIVFPRSGTWRFTSPDLPLPITRPTIQVVDPDVLRSCP